MEVHIKARQFTKSLAAFVLSLYLAQSAQAVDQYSSFGDQASDHGDGSTGFGSADPFDGALGTPDGGSFASPSKQSVQSQEQKVDAEMSDVGGNDFLYPASSGLSTPDQIENASSYASEVIPPPSYPRSEAPAKRYEKAAKKKTWAKKAKKSKNKFAKKNSKKSKKVAQSKSKRKKNNRYSRNG